jgi:signal transduction histidine kinase
MATTSVRDARKGGKTAGSLPPGIPDPLKTVGAVSPDDIGSLTGSEEPDLDAFHEELRARNLPIVFWTACIFNPTYFAWTAFDYVLAPDHWVLFMSLRIAAVTVNTLIVIALYRLGLRRYSWEGFWSLAFVYAAFVAIMIPMSGDNLVPYVMGFTIIILGAGILPVWPLRWSTSLVGSMVLFSIAVALLNRTSSADVGAVYTGVFVIATGVGLSTVAGLFKYDLAKRDYLSRVQLSLVAQRESEARLNLARTSDDLQHALEKLKELDRLKSKFFANISHELRTPLTLILAPVEELDRGLTADHQKRQLKVIRKNAERLLGLINDLLDLSRLDAGGLRLNLAEMDVRSVATAVHENSQPAALAKSISFNLLSDPSDNKVWGDAHRLEIVLTNLVSNAIKFTPAGGRIDMRVADTDHGTRIEVEDNGLGIPAEDLPRVFERFFQVNPADRRREGGVGIGLALAKELVQLHGGTIEVESEPGVFTRFSVFLPFGRDHIRPDVIERRQAFEPPIAHRRREEDDRLSDYDQDVTIDLEEEDEHDLAADPMLIGDRRPQIVLVEDHDEVRDFIQALLEPRFEVLLAANGREGWELIREESPDLVVSDVMMPEMSGTELCRLIKSDPALRVIPVILLTARVGSEATLEAYAYGADDFVAKPFHPRVLMARIRAQLRLRTLGLQLAQQEKLAVVGTLAAGILHEVRNPVNAIINASRVLSQGAPDPGVSGQLLDVISDAARRIDGITAALDSHARPAEAGKTSASDVREGLDSTIKLLGHRLNNVELHRDFATERLAEAPAGPLNQVFLNLLDNALRAGAGNIWLRVDEEEDHLRIIVEDDGPGISGEDAKRVFDPFFTKRSDGSGTGLGLYLSRKIVEEHKGSLRLDSREGGGARFTVTLPAIGAAIDKKTYKEAPRW